MIDKTPLEQAALAATLMPLWEITQEIDRDKPLSAWSREEVLTMVEGVVDAWQNYLQHACLLENSPAQPQNSQPQKEGVS
jgi:hypothetical protein